MYILEQHCCAAPVFCVALPKMLLHSSTNRLRRHDRQGTYLLNLLIQTEHDYLVVLRIVWVLRPCCFRHEVNVSMACTGRHLHEYYSVVVLLASNPCISGTYRYQSRASFVSPPLLRVCTCRVLYHPAAARIHTYRTNAVRTSRVPHGTLTWYIPRYGTSLASFFTNSCLLYVDKL